MRFGLCAKLIVLLLLSVSAVGSAEEIKHVVRISVDGLAASDFDDPQADLVTAATIGPQEVPSCRFL